MESVSYELENILSTLDNDDYFADFLNTKSLEAGIMRVRIDQNDTQTSHSMDELYYVIEGEGYLRINGKNHKVRKGTIIFVPANSEHNFHGNQADLIVLYIFPKT
jgi:mannose-6-phosphate isomerase-like protein (cupin superfamily)